MSNLNTLNEMLEDLQTLIDRGHGDASINIFCKNCDCIDGYNGATLNGKVIQITVNEE